MVAAQPPDPEVADVLARLRVGDEAAARQIFYRYARRLVELATDRLGDHLRPKLDPEDVIQSVFRSFFRRCRGGEWEFRDWNGLWELLVVITLRKCANWAVFYRAGRRDGNREAAFPADPPAPDLTPAEAAELADQLATLLAAFDDRGRLVLVYILQGFTAAEVAARVGCSERTVQRTLDRARRRLCGGEAGDAAPAGG